MAALDDMHRRMMAGMKQGNEDGNVIEMAQHAVEDEADAVKDYTKMLAACKNPAYRKLIAETLADEKKHEGYMRRIANAR